MIGIIPGTYKTFVVIGKFDESPIEGKLYIDPISNRIYMYSLKEKRSNPNTGYFPIWDGINTYITKFSNEKYLNDVILTDVSSLSLNVDKDTANRIIYQHRRCENSELLEPLISDGDNMFTQCIKGILNVKKYTLIDLVDKSNPKLSEEVLYNYYSALTKITFMRLDKWLVWMNHILHMWYMISVYKNDQLLLTYNSKQDKFDVPDKYNYIIEKKADHFKKIIKILVSMENIQKSDLRSSEVDDYTINNMLTTLSGEKSLSAQLFSRFIRMANLNYKIQIFEGDDVVFEYGEF